MHSDDEIRGSTSVTVSCEHGAECHDGTESSAASAPEASRAWLLIEHPGPWPHEAAEAAQPAPLAELVEAAEECRRSRSNLTERREHSRSSGSPGR